MTGFLDDLMEEDSAAVAKDIPADEALEGIALLVQKMQRLEKLAEEQKQQYDDIAKDLRTVAEKALPEAMEAIGLKSVTLKDGTVVEIKDDVYASISAKNKDAAHDWLRKMGFEDIIKNEVVASFGRGQDRDVEALSAHLEAAGVTWSRKEAVHAGTLKAFIKEQLKLGNDIPLDTFGAFIFQKAHLK